MERRASGVIPEETVELEDSELVTWAAKGRQDALDVLYDRHANLAYSLAMRMLGDAEASGELVQEAFLRLWQHAASYQGREGAVVTWLLSLVRSLGVDELRNRRSRPQRGARPSGEDEGVLNLLPDLQAGDENDGWVPLRRRRIREALQVLSAEQRRTIELAYFQGHTQEEIARLTGEPLSTIKSRLRLSLRKLRTVLQPEDLGVETL